MRASRGCLLAVTLFGLGVLLASLLAGAGTPAGAGPASARILAFDPAQGVVSPGQKAASSARIKNTGGRLHTFWIGYSVRDGAGRWHDVPSQPVRLKPGQVSAPQVKAWEVPSDPLTTTGPYDVRASVWRTQPENGGAVRLANAGKTAAFSVRLFQDGFDTLDATRWDRADQVLGRSRLDPANVGTEGGQLGLKIPARTLDGAAVRSRDLYQYGDYRTRLKVPDAPGSITGFFLYEAPDYEREVDIEIYNDGSRRISFSTYSPHYAADGSLIKGPTHTVTKTLPFDPSSDFHDYAFSFYPDSVGFSVDGQLMQTWPDALPKTPMKLWLNVWYPDWLQGERSAIDRYLYVDRAQH